MAIECPNCGKKFRGRDALCHDWRDPEKALGCPGCQVFLVKKKQDGLPQWAWLVPWVPAILLIQYAGRNGDVLFGILGAATMLAIPTMDLCFKWWKGAEFTVSPYQPSQSEPEN